jgi:hypothetical protein
MKKKVKTLSKTIGNYLKNLIKKEILNALREWENKEY